MPTILTPKPTKPHPARPKLRTTLQDLNATRTLGVFRKPSIIRRLLEILLRTRR